MLNRTCTSWLLLPKVFFFDLGPLELSIFRFTLKIRLIYEFVFQLQFYLGAGSTLGVGVYVIIAQVAKEEAGPAIVISVLVAGVTALLSGILAFDFFNQFNHMLDICDQKSNPR